ncbi:MAG: hypothetical protein R3B96_12115 [Pirellulaceae bacterium]
MSTSDVESELLELVHDAIPISLERRSPIARRLIVLVCSVADFVRRVRFAFQREASS